ncbi:MAG: SDR family oxidoreductase [Candidatus Saccharibacteria bacterium]|nr:SDR family oxidoreductase [Candidatus Saccharibacteria bacterium]
MVIVFSSYDENFPLTDYDGSFFSSEDTIIFANSPELGEEHEEDEPHFYYETTNLENQEQAKQFFEIIKEKFGEIDVFINNTDGVKNDTQSINANKRVFFSVEKYLPLNCFFINITSSRQLIEDSQKIQKNFQDKNIAYLCIDGRISNILNNYKIQKNGSILVSSNYKNLINTIIRDYEPLRDEAIASILENCIEPALKSFAENAYRESEECRTQEEYFSLRIGQKGISLPVEQPLFELIVIYSTDTQKIEQLKNTLAQKNNLAIVEPSDKAKEDVLWNIITKEKQYISAIICDNPIDFAKLAKSTAPNWATTIILDIQKV